MPILKRLFKQGSRKIVAAALGDQRRRELRTTGAAMSTDEAVSYALANIDPKLLTGLVTPG